MTLLLGSSILIKVHTTGQEEKRVQIRKRQIHSGWHETAGSSDPQRQAGLTASTPLTSAPTLS